MLSRIFCFSRSSSRRRDSKKKGSPRSGKEGKNKEGKRPFIGGGRSQRRVGKQGPVEEKREEEGSEGQQEPYVNATSISSSKEEEQPCPSAKSSPRSKDGNNEEVAENEQKPIEDVRQDLQANMSSVSRGSEDGSLATADIQEEVSFPEVVASFSSRGCLSTASSTASSSQHQREVQQQGVQQEEVQQPEETEEERQERWKHQLLNGQQEREDDAATRNMFVKKQRVRYHHRATDVYYDDAVVVGVHFDDGPDKPYYTIRFTRHDVEIDEDGNEGVTPSEVEKQTTPDRLEQLPWDPAKTWTLIQPNSS